LRASRSREGRAAVPWRPRPTARRHPQVPAQRSLRRYLVFVGCPVVIPVSAADAGYSDALSFFARPRALREFTARYGMDERPRVLAFLDLLVHNDILRM